MSLPAVSPANCGAGEPVAPPGGAGGGCRRRVHEEGGPPVRAGGDGGGSSGPSPAQSLTQLSTGLIDRYTHRKKTQLFLFACTTNLCVFVRIYGKLCSCFLKQLSQSTLGGADLDTREAGSAPGPFPSCPSFSGERQLGGLNPSSDVPLATRSLRSGHCSGSGRGGRGQTLERLLEKKKERDPGTCIGASQVHMVPMKDEAGGLDLLAR